MALQLNTYTVMLGSESITFANAFLTLSGISMVGPASNDWNPEVVTVHITMSIWDSANSAAYNSGFQPLGSTYFSVVFDATFETSMMTAMLTQGDPDVLAFFANTTEV